MPVVSLKKSKGKTLMSFLDIFRKKKKGMNDFDQAIESIKSGDWDYALELLRGGLLALTKMDRAQQGNYIMAQAVLEGAAGNTNTALHSVRTALKMCPQESPNGRLLNILGHRIENPPDTYEEAPAKIAGRPVDSFYYLIAQVTINMVELGEIGDDELVNQLNRVMSDEFHRMQKRAKG